MRSLLTNYTGDLNGCLVNCSDQGNCILSNSRYVCSCFEFFRGSDCSININPCSKRVCINNGKCNLFQTQSGDYTYNCTCTSEYYGTNCQNEVDHCQNFSCSGHGNCVSKSGKAACKCFYLFEGENCQNASSQLVTYRRVIAVTTVIAIAILTGFVLLICLNDLQKVYVYLKTGDHVYTKEPQNMVVKLGLKKIKKAKA